MQPAERERRVEGGEERLSGGAAGRGLAEKERPPPPSEPALQGHSFPTPSPRSSAPGSLGHCFPTPAPRTLNTVFVLGAFYPAYAIAVLFFGALC